MTSDMERDTRAYEAADARNGDPEHSSRCARCAGPWPVDIISPYGVGHLKSATRAGFTHCGLDATGPAWWWYEP